MLVEIRYRDRVIGRSLLLRLNSAQRLSRCDDRDVPISLEIEQVGIARGDEIGFSGERASKYVIIIGIANDLRHGLGLNDNGDVQVSREQFIKGESAALNVLSESRVAQGGAQLRHKDGTGIKRDAAIGGGFH